MSRWTRQAGRISPLTVFGASAVVLLGVGFFFAQESVGTVGSKFMDALARGDVTRLTEMSYMADLPREEIRKKWDFTVNKAAPYYRFTWNIAGANETKDGTGNVRLKVQRNIESGGAYDENFQLPLIKTNDGWKVDVRSISRDMYPGLPR